MVKLKDLLKESSPGFENRKFGDPLPKLKDITKRYQEANGIREEGTCGYGLDGELGDEPAGPHLLNKEAVDETALPMVQVLNVLSADIRRADYKKQLEWGAKNSSKVKEIIKAANMLSKIVKKLK